LYRNLQRNLAAHVREFLRQKYDLELANVSIEQPPNVELGEYALTLAFELAKKLRKAPKKIAEEISEGLGALPGIEKIEVAGAGYINIRVNRATVAASVAADEKPPVEIPVGHVLASKVLVEHSSINPNKAAHVGHLRNAILGDTFVRLLRAAGRTVDVQNYIDNTGVQVADVIVGFLHIEKKSRAEIEALTQAPRFDYYCWDLYARVAQWYEAAKENRARRAEVLHDLELGNNETSVIAEIVATAVLRRHLETMDRLDIQYDFLPRESEILHLHFWAAAFERLKDEGVLAFETEGKNKGCWVMRRAGLAPKQDAEAEATIEGMPEDPAASPTEIAEDDQKVIVRSNGTVGYVGKDIAYHMWKFGLLGKDFGYRKFHRYASGQQCWISAIGDEPDAEQNHPHFGDVAEIYNVIDARQSEAQNTVIEALRGLGHSEKADHYTHFSYEMVALTPRCAEELGYQLSDEDKGRSYIEVSGRKGFGVKADDLLDRLITSAQKEVDSRHPELAEADRQETARLIAVGALRFFMLKFTKPSVIAFDFKEALSFDGETGPYCQYGVVRATNIFRKGGLDPDTFSPTGVDFAKYLNGEAANELWSLWLAASRTSLVVEQCIATSEPAYAAKHAFQLAQMFNSFYHHHPILAEEDASRKQFLLATAAVVRRELIRVLGFLGMPVPPVM